MSVKLLIEITPDGERCGGCGECRCQYPFEGEFECGAFDAQLKKDAEFGDRLRLPACIAAQVAAKGVSVSRATVAGIAAHIVLGVLGGEREPYAEKKICELLRSIGVTVDDTEGRRRENDRRKIGI